MNLLPKTLRMDSSFTPTPCNAKPHALGGWGLGTQTVVSAMRAALMGMGLMMGLGMNTAHGETYPIKPIRVIIPAGAGDSCDTLVRVLGPRVSERIGQPLVIDNRPGSSGQLGLSLIKQAPPDGYTLGCGQGGNMVIVPLVYQKVPYDTKKDFAPIALLASNFLALIVGPTVPFKTTEEFIAHGRKNPGKITFGTNGEGAFLHMATEQFSQQAGITYLHVPYKSMPDVFTSMLGGQIDASLASYIAAEPLIAAGKLKMLGIARTSRLPDYPTVPTLAETLPGFASGGWFGMIAPTGAPPEAIALLNKEFNLALKDPEIIERMKKLGLDTHTESPQYFTDTINSDLARWGKLLKDIDFKKM
jgi:tripartite-type tricarboxylate transporter receptor subunit TctC